MPDFRIAVPVFIAAQLALVHWAVGPEQFPLHPDPRAFPATFGEWRFAHEDALNPGDAEQLDADLLVSRGYQQPGSTIDANVFVAWYGMEKEGLREPHSPRVCLPASGWETDRSDVIPLKTGAGDIRVNRLLVHNGGQLGAMVYWYQTPHGAVPGEWGEKLWRVAGAVLARRTDGAFVRVFVPFAAGGGENASGAAESLASAVYPNLREYLPR